MPLALLASYCEAANRSNSNNDKMEATRQHLTGNLELQKIINYVYDETFKIFYLTSKNLVKRPDLSDPRLSEGQDIYYVLDALRNRLYTGHQAIALVNGFVVNNPEFKDLIHCIIDRNLKTRIDAKTINKVIPDLVPIYDVALGEKYDQKRIKDEHWWVSWKRDGCRCTCEYDDQGEVIFRFRSGKTIETLGELKVLMESLNLRNVVLDGEIIMQTDGMDDLRLIMKYIMRKDYTIPLTAIKYVLFDALTKEEFVEKHADLSLEARYERLRELVTPIPPLEILPQYPLEKLDDLKEEAAAKGWEGLIVRRNGPYKGKRSTDVLKYKVMEDIELEVVGTTNGVQRVIARREDGTTFEAEGTMLSAVQVLYKGNTVGVGSGFTWEDRNLYYRQPELIVGKHIKIRYKQETQDQYGKPSLQFPIFKGIREVTEMV